MGRLNLICNGMMIFNEVDPDHIDIVIPTIPGHVRKYCVDQTPPDKTKLYDLQTASYRLDGPVSSGQDVRDLFDPNGCMVLSNDLVDFDDQGAAAVSAVITVPKPDVVRLFRGCEPVANVVVAGPVGRCAVEVQPVLLNDIAVLSYKNLPAGTALALGLTSTPGSLAQAQAGVDPDTINWILYSNETVGPQALVAHPTTLNDFLEVDGRATDFGLSGFGFQDGACETSIGMHAIHMALFHELPPLEGPDATNSGPAGCSFLVLAD